jgi:hypothetical protein
MVWYERSLVTGRRPVVNLEKSLAGIKVIDVDTHLGQAYSLWSAHSSGWRGLAVGARRS